VPDLIVVVHKRGHITATDHLHATNAVGFLDPALVKVVANSQSAIANRRFTGFSSIFRLSLNIVIAAPFADEVSQF